MSKRTTRSARCSGRRARFGHRLSAYLSGDATRRDGHPRRGESAAWKRPSRTSRRRTKAAISISTDVALQEAVAREGARRRRRSARAVGRDARHARRPSRSPTRPTAIRRSLRTLDRRGERIDAVEFHPAWHALMQLATRGRRALRAVGGAGPGRAGRARSDVFPACAGRERHAVSADDDLRQRAGAAASRGDVSGVATPGSPRVLARDYDPRPLPVAEKRAALIGMGMTERQGGSDVRANLHARRRPPATAHGASPATSGSSRRRNAMRISCSRRPTPGVTAFCCRACCPTARATPCASTA